jgi:hypothetical protein
LIGQQIEWGKSISNFGPDKGVKVVYDKYNYLYILANFYGNPIIKNTTVKGSAIIKYNLQGDILWVLSVEGTAKGISLDNNGNIFICGVFENTAKYGDSIFVSEGQQDIYIAKINAEGNYLWAVKAGGIQNDEILAVCTNNSGNVTACAFMGMSAKINGNIINTLGGGSMLIQYANNGSFKWAKQEGYNNYPFEIIADNNGDFIVSGYYSWGSNFGGTNTFSGSGGFVAKYDNAGIFKWIFPVKNSQWNYVQSINLDNNNNIYACGVFKDTATFASTSFISYSFKDIFAMKLNSNGNLQWAKQSGYYDEDYAYCGVISGSNYYIARAWGKNYPTNTTLFIQSFDIETGNSTLLWKSDSVGVNEIHSITSDSEGKIYITGLFNDTLKLSSSYKFAAYSITDKDYFIVKINPAFITQLIKKQSPEKSFILYPNPTNEYIYLQNFSINKTSIKLVNITGRIVFSAELSPEESSPFKLNVASFSNEFYKVLIVDGNNTYHETLIIKR